MINSNQNIQFTKFYLFPLVLIIVIIVSSCNKEEEEAFCNVTFAVDNEVFYQGCTIPISIFAGEGMNKETQVQLFINNEDKGFISTAPYKYYWETGNTIAGSYSIKAIYTSSDNMNVTDEKNINLQTSSVNCPTYVSDFDGNDYTVVQIGSQCWMQENLKTTHYHDGKALIMASVITDATPLSSSPGTYFAYQQDTNNVPIYGYLYTWTAAMNGNSATESDDNPIQGICPDGWHMPSVHEWRTLIDHVGGMNIAANKLKDTDSSLWIDNLETTDNSSGFSVLPGGCGRQSNSYFGKGTLAYFHSGTETIPNHAYHFFLKNKSQMSFLLGHEDSKRFGYSVRCLKD